MPRIVRSHLLFTYRDEEAQTVELFGDFSGHMEVVARMVRGSDGEFQAAVPMPVPGRYRYKFIVNGERWVEDPAHSQKVADGFGGFNSLWKVGWEVQ